MFKKFLVFCFVICLSWFFVKYCFAYTPKCYSVIEGKANCSGLEHINDVVHSSQLKCFEIDKKASDCGIFVSVLPNDTDKSFMDQLETLDCTGSERNTFQCVDFCYHNYVQAKCTNCDNLTDLEKESYAYCQDIEDEKWCEAVADDGNGSSWQKTLAGTENVTGTCLNGYTGSPVRNCLSSGVWDSISTTCSVVVSE